MAESGESSMALDSSERFLLRWEYDCEDVAVF